MTKIPSKPIIAAGVKVLADIYAEIDKQIGAEQKTQDGKVSDAEIATFLRQRGSASSTVGAVVAGVSAYVKHIAKGDVPVDTFRITLDKITAYVDRDRDKGVNVEDMKATWRAIALFSAEVDAKALTAKSIVADRSVRLVGDVGVADAGLKTISDVFMEIGGNKGKVSVDDVRAFLARGSSVPTATESVRLLTRYLENRTKRTEFTKADVDGALAAAGKSIHAAAKDGTDRARLATTWQSLLAFADENAVRKKDAKSIVGATTTAPATTTPSTTPAPAATGSKAASVAAFLKLSTDDKVEILEDYGNLHGHYKTTGEKPLDQLTGKEREFADKMKKELLSLVGDFEEDSGVYGTIGGLRSTVEVIALPTGEIVGGRVSLFQKGFNAEDAPQDANGDTPYHFDTAAEAKKAGVDPDEDISWAVNGLFEVTTSGGAKQLGDDYSHVDDHWEWTGY